MALPHTYTQTVNTVTTATLDALTTDLTQIVNDGDYTLLRKMASKGRIKRVKDCEKISHPLLYGNATSTLRYDPTTGANRLAGNSGTLSAAAVDVLDKALFSMQSATINVNFPQADPDGDVISTSMARVRSEVMKLLKEEERLFLRGVTSAPGVADSALHAPYTGDTDFVAGYSMSAPSLFQAYGTATADKWANIIIDNHAEWAPGLEDTASATGANLLTDFQSAWNNHNYGGMEVPDYLLTSQGVWEKFVDLLRAKSTINDKVVANMGVGEREVPYSGMTVSWSREISTLKSTDGIWDVAADTTKEAPILGFNLKSLRWNTVVGAGVSDPVGAGVFQFLNEAQLHPLLTNYFRRLATKACWSVENGRRSFFHIQGCSLVD